MGHYDKEREAADSLLAERKRDEARARLRDVCDKACADSDNYLAIRMLRHLKNGDKVDALFALLKELTA
jgi:hypothetical protein